MTTHVVRLPDVGEGVAEAELVSWQVAVGDEVHPDSVLAEVLTDKATVEIYAPVAGRVASVHGAIGDILAIGSDLVHIDIGGAPDVDVPALTAPVGDPVADADDVEPPPPQGDGPDPAAPTVPDAGDGRDAGTAREHSSLVTSPVVRRPGGMPPSGPGRAFTGDRPVAAPAVRQRARDLGIDLRLVHGTGPAQRVTHADLDTYVAGTSTARRSGARAAAPETTRVSADVPVVGLRRRIAERMSTSASRIPHITYVDEVDVGQVDELRRTLNATYPDHARLTLLPFLMRAIVLATADQPHVNATFDDEAGVLHTSGPVHIGIATQTPNGLLVPVVRDAERRDLWQSAAEVARVSGAARTSKATRDELSGSTITITSLGALGGLVTTPIINHPEVAIVGVNKMQVRPVWDGTQFRPRTMMNLSSSFDHRVVDGWDAATFVQRIKALLETPSLLFLGAPGELDPPDPS